MITLAQRFKSQTEVVREAVYQAGCDLRVAIPGIVNTFDPVKQTVTVRVAIREVVNINGVATIKEIPLLLDVPIQIPRGGGFSLTLPIQQGDECLVVFADMCIDAWWSRGGVQNQVMRRRHDLSDAFAIFGPWSQQRTIPNYNPNSAELRSDNGTVKITLDAGDITVTAPKVNVNGSQQVNINGAGQTFIEGRNFLTHEHSGVSAGGGVSGPVV